MRRNWRAEDGGRRDKNEEKRQKRKESGQLSPRELIRWPPCPSMQAQACINIKGSGVLSNS